MTDSAHENPDGTPEAERFTGGRPVHFEIQAEDVPRAAAFYAAAFGWEGRTGRSTPAPRTSACAPARARASTVRSCCARDRIPRRAVLSPGRC